eukprot:3132406-Amphidinium_carterae.1
MGGVLCTQGLKLLTPKLRKARCSCSWSLRPNRNVFHWPAPSCGASQQLMGAPKVEDNTLYIN